MKKLNKDKMNDWVALLISALIMSSCVYGLTDEDWEKNGRVRLSLDWQTLRNYPSDMTYYFYKDGAVRPVIRTGSSSGYEGTLPAGSYKVIVCNTDCENVLLETDNGYDAAYGKVRQVSVLKSTSVQVAGPVNFYGTGSRSIEVAGKRITTEVLYPANLVRTLELNIKVIGGEAVGDITGMAGRLTGVAPQVHIPTGNVLFDPPAFMVFEPLFVGPGVYTSTLSLFGLSGEKEAAGPVDLYLTLTMADGKEIALYTDITGEVNEAFTTSLSAHIILDLAIAWDEINGATITLTGWKEGTAEAEI